MDNRGNSVHSSAGGVGFSGLLTLVFIVLKLCHVIDWPWVMVLSPIWITLALILFILVVIITISVVSDKRKKIR